MTTKDTVSDRDWDRADAWLGLTSLGLIFVLPVISAVLGAESQFRALVLLVFLTHPYVLLRVVRHVRIVPRWWGQLLVAGASIGTVLAIVLPAPRPTGLRVAFVIIALLQIAAAAALASTARAHQGLTNWRMTFAATGAAFFALLFVMQVLAASPATYPYYARSLALQRYLLLVMFATYYLGLVPPARLRRWLQRAVEYAFLRRVNERSPDERGRLVSIDLATAAQGSTATSGALVLLGTGPLHIDSATRADWRGRTVESVSGGVGRALTTRAIVNGPVAELESPLREMAGPAERFLAVPIVSGTRVWGVLLILQLKRSLFPKDDIAILQRLCRYTAEIFDHGQLIADERARQQREADARLDLILESLQDYAVITADDDGRVTSWNAGAKQVFLYPTAEAMGQPISALFDDGAPWLNERLVSARKGEPMLTDTIGKRRDDSRFTTSLVIRPLLARAGRSTGYVIVMRDVSQQRLLEDRLRQSQKLEAIGRLAAGVAHDFNNMLTVILGYASNLDEVLPAEHRPSLGEIRKAGERAASLTKQLLAFSRQQTVQPRVIALPEIVAALLPMLSRLLGEHIEIVEVMDAAVPRILADPTQLEQVIMNLAVNARDAMPSGGKLTIRVRSVLLSAEEAVSLTGRPGPYVLLEVADTGSGVDIATQTRMFEPFFTTKGVGRGTGLGLAMVYGTVQHMNGAIAVESELGKGTTFRIYVPPHVK